MQERAAIPYRRAHVYFFLLLLVAVIGFYPSYFSRLKETGAVHHFHGITATAWMVLLIVQGWLMSARKFSSHRAIGKFSFLLAPLFVVSGILVIHAMLVATNGFARTYGARLAFVDIVSIAYFAIAYFQAIANRKNPRLHARYLASTAILALPPALGRALGSFVPGIDSFDAAFHWSFFITELIVVALIVDDVMSKKISLPYPILLVLVLLQHASFLVIPHVTWWNAIVAKSGAL